eukprot:GILI01008893.1.p1 GENE.GILI01008893.1~~GILI01008893.1.p1  ORF type:complete len:708 (+),score=105.91 GILI01008893.1:65-2188(+)
MDAPKIEVVEDTPTSKWDSLNYLRGKIEGSNTAQRKKHRAIEKYAVLCTVEGPEALKAAESTRLKNRLFGSQNPNGISLDQQPSNEATPSKGSKGKPNSNRGSPLTLPARKTPTSTPPSINTTSKSGIPASGFAFPSAPIASPQSQSEEIALASPSQLQYTFYLLPKDIVRKDNLPSKQLMVMPMCPVEVTASANNSLAFCCDRGCGYAHLLSGTRDQLINISGLGAGEGAAISVRDGAAVFEVTKAEVEPTVGFYFACYLRQKDRLADLMLGAVSHDLCPRYRKGLVCEFGARCLRVHSKKRTVDKGPIDATTPLEEVFNTDSHFATSPNSSSNTNDGVGGADVTSFVKTTGLRTVGDVCRLGEDAYGILIARFEKSTEMAPLLNRIGSLWRCEDLSMPVELAVMCFPGVTRADVESIPSSLHTVGQVVESKVKDLASSGLRMGVLEACLQIRARNRTDDGPMYKQITLTGLPKNAFLVRMTEEVCKFRERAHASWRKQDATRPIVTSLFTYVDPAKCKCTFANSQPSKQVESAATPRLGPLSPAPTEFISHSTPGGSTQVRLTQVESCSTTDYPWASHWCRCPRSFQRAVNYELSTPSGSRCSEQNCLGMLASLMLPTDAIREVFVHGSHHNGEDPNPLFPCGVCENMLRRVSKDIFKKTGGQLLLFMFSAVDNPRKLVWMPVTEMSHREGSTFKRFLDEEVRLM